MRKLAPIHIVSSRVPGDRHDWVLVRGSKYRCALCGYTMPVEPTDMLVLRSGCPQSKVVLEKEEQEKDMSFHL